MLSKEWQDTYMALAIRLSEKSKDGSSKVGACLVRPDKTIASMGFNGFPARIKDVTAYLNGTMYRAEKYKRIVHAEANCLRHRRDFDLTGYTMLVSQHPCAPCALEMACTGITSVYYKAPTPEFLERWQDSLNDSKTIFREAGIELIEWVA